MLLILKYRCHCYISFIYIPRIQRAWRASMSRRGSWHGQDKNRTSHQQDETVPSKSLQDPVMTTNISPVRMLKENQKDNHMVRHENEAGGERSGRL